MGHLVLCLRGQREHIMLEREALQRGQGLHLEWVAVEREAGECGKALKVSQLLHAADAVVMEAKDLEGCQHAERRREVLDLVER